MFLLVKPHAILFSVFYMYALVHLVITYSLLLEILDLQVT